MYWYVQLCTVEQFLMHLGVFHVFLKYLLCVHRKNNALSKTIRTIKALEGLHRENVDDNSTDNEAPVITTLI